MLGNFQQSQIRIEIDADRQTIADSLLKTAQLRQWMWPQSLSSNLPDTLNDGLTFNSSLGLIEVEHFVETVDDNCLRLLLSKGIDGYHEWVWGDGWVQSRLEGISLLPLKLGHTFDLLKLRHFVLSQEKIKLMM
ncbi:MAG: hypothetical protein HC930_12705 [Hydrococcus sp. SU_1_0]|nr:hypothetical protein [Hydrococcus sp. SU_1_0]